MFHPDLIERALRDPHPDFIRHPDSCPALVLNADYTPLSYYPLSL
ncbi:MAG: HNH endonuclease, partial [Blastomonas fulva]|nr:HNH endonuclease [Blastomonas fulva]